MRKYVSMCNKLGGDAFATCCVCAVKIFKKCSSSTCNCQSRRSALQMRAHNRRQPAVTTDVCSIAGYVRVSGDRDGLVTAAAAANTGYILADASIYYTCSASEDTNDTHLDFVWGKELFNFSYNSVHIVIWHARCGIYCCCSMD
ncbi:unnamed protein product [Ceratitis capitata]|uniref:(Mediterranean fruit fly) hypothetical protein n=1 Tax=Ceratitis capitata TaxID=7213 RepID=A0A811UCV2_CERCA|nr:unnamed protein product [Ceratitis capitata]